MRVLAPIFLATLVISAFAAMSLPDGEDDLLSQLTADHPEVQVGLRTQSTMGCKSWCSGKFRSGERRVCGWSSCRGCDVCTTQKIIAGSFLQQAPTPLPPRTECATLPTPTNKSPKDVIPSLGKNWKLQTPCEEAELVGSRCAGRPTVLTKGAKKGHPNIASVKVGSTLGRFSMTSQCYTEGGRKIRSPAFYTAQDGDTDMVVFYTPTVGVTTSGSISPRVELREEKPSMGWSIDEHHTLTVSAKVVHVPHKAKSVAVMQIFNSGPFVEVMTRICKNEKMVDGSACEKGKVYMMVFMTQYLQDADGNKPNVYVMLDKYEMNTKFDLKVEVNGHKISFEYTPEGGTMKTYTAECRQADGCYKQDGTHKGGLHFKAGAYLQKIGTKEGSEYGQPYVMNEAADDYALVYMYGIQVE